MTGFNVTILGNGSAVPTATQHPSSQIVRLSEEQFMIDCGEGAQMQMIKYKIKHRKLNHLFVSHLHGDHYFGLFGLVATFHLFGREESLNIYAPSDLQKLLEHQLRVSKTDLRFNLNFHPLEDYKSTPLFVSGDYEVTIFPLYHRMPTWGVKIRKQDNELRVDKDFVAQYSPSIDQIISIKKGADYMTESGKVLKNKEITLPVRSDKIYVYCSDTVFNEHVIEHAKGADLLYHEATFDSSMQNAAKDKYHSTSVDAATVAKKAGVGKLLLGHYSARFDDLTELLLQARAVFPNTLLSEEGQTYSIK
ncbi:MAG: ribonuclease Z [Bacteroidetes bacterium]|nr:MAG: ribonuclease Z [Bacteroidota bacterium]